VKVNVDVPVFYAVCGVHELYMFTEKTFVRTWLQSTYQTLSTTLRRCFEHHRLVDHWSSGP